MMRRFAVTATLCLLMSVPAAAQTTPTIPEPPQKLIEIYRIAPGQHEAFLQMIAMYDEANRMAGLPPRELYVHQDGASWDFLLIQPAETPPEKKDALAAALKKVMGNKKHFFEFRKFIAEHTDTFASGPQSAAEFLARMKQ
jgi:membrane-bound lytic murein transglycosylase B